MTTNEVTTQRFNAHMSQDGKPMIVWDTGPGQQNQKKKFGYKSKGVKYPLRSKQTEPEPEPVVNTTKSKTSTRPNPTDLKSAKNVKNQNAAKKENKASSKPKGKAAAPDRDMVTLTQAQFDQILETIGELSVMADAPSAGNTTNTQGGVKPGGTDSSLDFDAPLPAASPPPPSAPPTADPASKHRDVTTKPDTVSHVITNSEPTTVPGLNIQSPRYPDPRTIPAGPVAGDVRSSTIGVPLAHLTKAERKRVEWERQRVEAEALKQQVKRTEALHNGATTDQVGQGLGDYAAIETKAPDPEPFMLPHVRARLDAEAKAKAAMATNNQPGQASNASQQPPANSSQANNLSSVNSQPTSVPGLSNQPASVPGLSNQSAPVPGLSNQSAPVPGLSNQPQNIPGVGNQPVPSNQAQGNTAMQNTAALPPKPLSKAELKKLQWQKERAAQEKEYDPWGRPGAGAPIKDNTGSVLADYGSRKQSEAENNITEQFVKDVVRMSLEDPRLQQALNQSQSAPQIPTQQQPAYQNQQQYQTPSQQGPGSQPYQAPVQQYQAPGQNYPALGQNPGQDEPPPAAIRSSFNVGAVAPDENKFMSAKERQKQQWLRDLEAQREEQRRMKEEEKRKDQEYFADAKPVHQYNYDYKQAGLPQQGGATNFQQPPPQQQNNQSYQQPNPYQPPQQQQQFNQSMNSSVPLNQSVSGIALDQSLSGNDADTFLRGQNVHLDPKTREEKEKVRRKELDYQTELKRQMDERQNEKQRERQRRWQEEAEEEAKLQAERDKLQRQYEMEQKRINNKKEAEERKQEMLKQAMENEKERAQWEKHERRMLKLRQGGHDISNYHATFEAKHTPRDGATSVITAAPSHIPGLGPAPSEPANYGAPSYRDHAPSQRNHAPSVMTSALSPAPLPPDDYDDVRSYATGVKVGSRPYDPYTENRVLTPSAHRPHHSIDYDANQREFGVQADLIGGGLSRESTDVEYTLQPKKRVRVKSAAEVKGPKKSSLKQSNTYTINKGGTRSAPPNRPKEAALIDNYDDYNQQQEKKPTSVKSRPAWGYQNTKNKKKINQSERDPLYAEKMAKREAMKARRQKTLENIANQNAPNVAKKTTASMRARSRSRDRVTHDRKSAVYHEDEFSEPSSLHVKTQNRVTGEKSRPLYARNRSPGPGVPALQNFANEERESLLDRQSKMSSNRHQQGSNRSKSRNRSPSPPVPVTRHNNNSRQYNADNYDYDSYRRNDGVADTGRSQRTKYGDRDPVGAPVSDGDFVPFIRSTNVLDPAHAESPVPMSREASVMVKARQAYIQEHEPARYGAEMENFQDSRLLGNVPSQKAPTYPKDPIMNPSLVTDHPSGRQTRILQQLSDLRRGLQQKQREWEVGLPPQEEVAG